MKGISPMIAVVLLIAFTVAVGAIISIWITGLTSTQTQLAGTGGEKIIKCSKSILDVTKVGNKTFTLSPTTSAGWRFGDFSVTIVYSSGTEDLYNFTVALTDSAGNVIQNTTVDDQYYKAGTTTVALQPGQTAIIPLLFSSNLTTSPISKVRVSAVCLDDQIVTFEDTNFD